MGYIGEGINQTATSVETAKDEFFGTYYGQISSDPTVDPNGEAITDGDLFYNTSEEALKIRVNGEWLSLRTATTGYQQFTATSGQTTFNVAGSFSPGFVFVTLNGVVLASGDYDDSSGTSIVLTSGAASGDILGVYLFDTFSVADTVSASAGGTFSGPVDFSDNINVDSGTLFVDSANNRVGVGTSSPQEELDVSGDIRLGSGGAGYLTATTGEILIGEDPSGLYIGTGFGVNPSFPLRLGSVGTTAILIYVGGSEAIRINSNRNVGIGTNTPSEKLEVNGNIIANGVYLGGTGSANKLDDYEEGTWTPDLREVGNSSFSITSYERRTGTYSRVGRVVHFYTTLRPEGTSNAGGGPLKLTGLPITPAQGTSNGLVDGRIYVNFQVIGGSGAPTNEAPATARIENLSAEVLLLKWDDLTNLDQIGIATTNMIRPSSDTEISLWGFYLVD